jgi:hypothetical protein
MRREPDRDLRRSGSPAEACRLCRLALPSVLVLLAGCATSGPVTVRRDRFNFNDATAESTKEQILVNIVRLRYGEAICFVDVGTMLSHYAISAGGHYTRYTSDLDVWNNPALRGVYGMRGEPVPGSRTWGANLDYEDSPTISYTPVTGEEFANRVMAPIPPTTIIYLSQSGWSMDRIMECCVQSINGLANAPIHEVSEGGPPDDSRFRRLAALLKKGQDAGVVRYGIEYDQGQSATYLYWPSVPAGWENESREVRDLLGLPEGPLNKVKLTGNAVRRQPDEVAMQTRSVLAAMYALAQETPVPSEHLRNHQATTRPWTQDDEGTLRWLHIQHSRIPQVDPFVQVFYNGYWFYIDKSDWSSKRTFALLTYLFSLQATAKGQAGPLVTVPAGK